MQKVLISISIIIFYSCSFLPEATGKENEIVVLISPEDKPFIQPLIEELFSQFIYTPQEEPEIKLTFRKPWELDDIQTQGNILLAALDFPPDSTGDKLLKRIYQGRGKDPPTYIIRDLYSKNQIFCVIHSLDAVALQKEIELNGDWLLNEFRVTINDRMEEYLFKKGRNKSISAKIEDIFGYTVHLQPDYKIIKADSLFPYIWLGRGYPYRWLTIHKNQKEKYNKPVKAWNQLNQDFSMIIPDIEIGVHFRSTQTESWLEKDIHLMRGIYDHSESESGGPFFVYIFETETSNEVILVSGFVNYPGHEKFLLLKQLEIIAKTLH